MARKQLNNLDVFQFGKVPPQAIELEEAILGALMLDDNHFTKSIMGMLNPRVFYKDAHIKIAEAIKEIKKEGAFPDILLVTQRLRQMGVLEEVGGAYYVTQLTNHVVSSANIEWHYRIVQQKYAQREFIRIMTEKVTNAFDDSCDIFELLESAERQLRHINPIHREIWESSSSDVSDIIESSLSETTSGIFMFYETGWPTFDKYIGTMRNKIVVLGGATGQGKSRFVSTWMFRLLEKYPQDIAIYWCTFEDSAEDIMLFYLSKMMKIKAKSIKSRNFDRALIPEIKEHIETWKSFDIRLLDKSTKIAWIRQRFESFREKRPDKFPILIIDNLLAVKDGADFKGNENAMENYVMSEILNIRQNTHALIILVHHYGKQIFKERLATGYRPLIDDLKGSERIPALANQVLLINNPRVFKDLMAQYTGESKEILKNLFILDPGKIRDDANEDESLIHFWCDMNTLTFEEIPKPTE